AAIAISVQTGNIGYAYEYPSASAASSAAVEECGAHDCQEVVRVTNGCAAVAQAENLAWGWAYAASLEEAKRAAVRGAPGEGAGARLGVQRRPPLIATARGCARARAAPARRPGARSRRARAGWCRAARRAGRGWARCGAASRRTGPPRR